jgi:hypothetical protein
MKTKHTGGPAFPQTHESWGGNGEANPVPDGMTLRDWFAGQALGQSMHDWAESDPKHAAIVANNCYRFADAMLSEREREA